MRINETEVQFSLETNLELFRNSYRRASVGVPSITNRYILMVVKPLKFLLTCAFMPLFLAYNEYEKDKYIRAVMGMKMAKCDWDT